MMYSIIKKTEVTETLTEFIIDDDSSTCYVYYPNGTTDEEAIQFLKDERAVAAEAEAELESKKTEIEANLNA